MIPAVIILKFKGISNCLIKNKRLPIESVSCIVITLKKSGLKNMLKIDNNRKE